MNTPPSTATAVVWGNCQAEPLADFLRAPLGRHGIQVVPVPPVYLVTAAELACVREIVSRCDVLISQPVRPEYRMPGTGTEELLAIAPPGVRLVTWPVAYDSSEFPFQVVGHGADGLGVFASLTSYHDLRLMIGAERGWDVDKLLAALGDFADAAELRAATAMSLSEMRKREVSLDVTVSGSLGRGGAMFTVNHPSNSVIAHIAEGVLRCLGIEDKVPVPAHEELDHTVTPLEPEVIAANGWDASPRGWSVAGEQLSLAEVITQHLQMYALRPDIIVDARTRYAERMATLGL